EDARARASAKSHQPEAAAAPSHCVDDAPLPHMNPSGHLMVAACQDRRSRPPLVGGSGSIAGRVPSPRALAAFAAGVTVALTRTANAVPAHGVRVQGERTSRRRWPV